MKRYVFTTLLLLCALTGFSSAQSRGSYFFENSLLRSKLNPAFAPKTDYSSVPVIGSLSVDMVGNVGLENFVYPEGDKNYLFLSDKVSPEFFLQKMQARRDPYLRERIESDLFGVGMKIGKDGFATAGFSVVSTGNVVLSNELLRFAKTGDAGVSRDFFSGGSFQFTGYAALSVGYSHDLHKLVEGLRAGLRFKLLFGLAAVNFSLDQLRLQFGESNLSASTQGNGALSGIAYDAANGLSLSKIGLRNIGAAVDLGASYRFPLEGLVDNIDISVSVCDLGSVHFKHDLTALSMNRSFSFSGISDLSGDIKEEFEQLISDIKGLTQIDASEGAPFTYVLSPSIHAGAAAYLFQNKLNAGLLYYHAVGYDNLMASCGYTPFDWLNLGVNWTFLGPASRLGFFAEFIPKKYVGLFFGMESASWRYNSSYIPIGNCTNSFSFGVNVLFGE